MRMHIELDDDLAAKVDELAGPRGRSAFVRNEEADAVRQLFAGLDVLPSALGAIGGAAGTGRAPLPRAASPSRLEERYAQLRAAS